MSDWQSVTLGSIATFKKGISYKTADYGSPDTGHPFLTIKCFVKGGGYEPTGIKFYEGFSTTADYLQSGDVLFAVTDLTRAGDIVGSPLRVPSFGSDKPAIASMDCMRLEPDSTKCSKGFIYHRLMLSDARRQMVAYSAGSTVLHLDTKKVPAIKLRIPLSTTEQNRIASILDLLDSAIERTESFIAKYQQIKSGLMHDLFTRGVTADGKLRPPREQAPELYQETPIGLIPKEWGVGSISEYLDKSEGIKPGPFGSSLKKEFYTESGYRVYGQEQVIAGTLDVGDYYISRRKFHEMSMFEVKHGDILISLVGTIGRVLVVREPFEAGIINPRLMRIRPAQGIEGAKFLKYLLVTSLISRQLEQYAGGGTMPVLNATVIRKLVVPIIETREQRRISQQLDAITNVITLEEDSLRKLTLKKFGLMHDLLTGHVMVEQ